MKTRKIIGGNNLYDFFMMMDLLDDMYLYIKSKKRKTLKNAGRRVQKI